MEKRKKKVIQKDVVTTIERFRVFGIENEYEYNIVLTKEGHIKTYDLYASDTEIWNQDIKGTLLLRVTNDGNGIQIGMEIKELEYHESGHLRLLLNFDNYCDKKEGLLPMEYTILPEVDLVIL